MLVSAKPVEVRGNKHLIVKAVDRVIQWHPMETYFNASIREKRFKVNYCSANPSRERPSQFFEIVSCSYLGAFRVCKRDAHLKPAHAFIFQGLSKPGMLLRKE